MSKLKPCPFCGGEAELCYMPALWGYALYASCKGCDAKSPRNWQEKEPKLGDAEWKDTADEWNRRPGEEALRQLWSSNLDIINKELNKQLAEALGEIKGLRQLVNDCHIVAGQLETERNEARAEIERKDKLIEQMREEISRLKRCCNCEYANHKLEVCEHPDNEPETFMDGVCLWSLNI